MVVELSAVIVAMVEDQPRILTIPRPTAEDGARSAALPAGPLEPERHRTLELGLRAWVAEQTRIPLGYVEQLYTFGDRGRHPREAEGGPRVISVGYLALARQGDLSGRSDACWSPWFDHFPWEDWREAKPPIIATAIAPALRAWAEDAPTSPERQSRWERVRLCFGLDGLAWDTERVLERYELLYEAGLVTEAARDRMQLRLDDWPARALPVVELGAPMVADHRRILATAMGRLRGKLKYRPVVFELMPDSFTLLELQRTVEAIVGLHLHKQNFRRLVERSGLVEGTGRMRIETGGRPAELFRFRPEVVRERLAPGVHVPPLRLRQR